MYIYIYIYIYNDFRYVGISYVALIYEGIYLKLLYCMYDITFMYVSLHMYHCIFTLPYLTLPYITLPYLTSPHLTSPHLTSPHLTSPHLTSPHLTSPHLTSPHLTSPHLTSPHLTSPHLTSPHLTSPHLTSPHLTSPHLTSPHLTSPHLTSPHQSTCIIFVNVFGVVNHQNRTVLHAVDLFLYYSPGKNSGDAELPRVSFEGLQPNGPPQHCDQTTERL